MSITFVARTVETRAPSIVLKPRTCPWASETEMRLPLGRIYYLCNAKCMHNHLILIYNDN